MRFFNFNSKNGDKPDRKLCVLHVDDSQWIRIPVSVMLRRNFGMRVLEAGSGVEGLQMALVNLPDLIILDVMMPQMDGFDTLVKLKENERTQAIPVLMCTARDVTRDVNMALKLGAVGYITKPIEEELLLNKVREILVAEGKWGTESKPIAPASPVDVVIPAPVPVPASSRAARPCPACRKELSYIQAYDAWYCYPCRKYPDFEQTGT